MGDATGPQPQQPGYALDPTLLATLVIGMLLIGGLGVWTAMHASPAAVVDTYDGNVPNSGITDSRGALAPSQDPSPSAPTRLTPSGTPQGEGCIDSDGGQDIYVNGIITVWVGGRGVTEMPGDTCISNYRVNEAYCPSEESAGVSYAQHPCVYGCISGACVRPKDPSAMVDINIRGQDHVYNSGSDETAVRVSWTSRNVRDCAGTGSYIKETNGVLWFDELNLPPSGERTLDLTGLGGSVVINCFDMQGNVVGDEVRLN